MAFRTTYSRVENSGEAQTLSSLEMVVVINNQRVGRVQGLRYSGQAAPRPVQELGSDRVIEFVPGIKNFSGSIQSMTIQYGDIIKRLASMSGANIDPDSYAATLSNFPEFDIQVFNRGNPDYRSPELYAPAAGALDLAGNGQLFKTLIGCVIESFDSNLNANEALIMESVSFRFVDIVTQPQARKDISQVARATA